jgi:NADH-quinone oxidoreductase subunit M
MVVESSMLSLLMLLPLIGAVLIFLFARGDEETAAKNARSTALLTTMATFAVSLVLWKEFDPSVTGYQFEELRGWFGAGAMQFRLGIDGISLFMILLTTLLMPICVLCSWTSVTKRVREYMMAFLALEAMVIGVFCSLDIVLFYLFFEGMLIPMFLIIGIWGGDNRVYASYKFFLYTLAGSVLLLVVILYLYVTFGTTDIPTLTTQARMLPLDVQRLLWFGMFASFAVKVPMWPFHTWLPDAHVQAPTAGSVILAGILLKMGAYGFLRFSLPMLPEASKELAIFVFILSAGAVVVTSLIALVQEDMKKLIAYSSVAHMGFVTAGIFSFNQQGVEGAVMQMISHGLVSGALFLCVGVVYDRLHTREIARYGGLVNIMPKYAVLFMFFTMASAGLPGTSGFVGEFLVLAGVFQAHTWIALLVATGMVLGAAYALWLYRRVVFGELARNDLKKMTDLNRREMLLFIPLALLTLWLGIYPKPIFTGIETAVQVAIAPVNNLSPAVDVAATAEPTNVTTPEGAN